MVVGWRAGRLDDEDVLTTHILINGRENLIVSETAHLGPRKWNIEIISDGGCQGLIGVACKQFHDDRSPSKRQSESQRNAIA
jgi:hypothetical protein